VSSPHQISIKTTGMDGYFSQDKRPAFSIELYGHSRKWKIPIEAILDTGFNGFLSLPLKHCLKAGLILASTTSQTLANGQNSSTLLCWGTVLIGQKKVVGLISISSGGHALLGMEFLEKLKAKLEVDPVKKTVKLV